MGAHSVALAFVRNSKARRYILRFHDGVARVTIPRGGSLQYAEEFARKNSGWIQKQLLRAPTKWGDGTEVWFRGNRVTLSVSEDSEGPRVKFADQILRVQHKLILPKI